jgi:hypothetical protein
LTSGGCPPAPCASAWLRANNPELASMPVVANAAPRRIRALRVKSITSSSKTEIDDGTIAPTSACRDGVSNVDSLPDCRHVGGRATLGGTERTAATYRSQLFPECRQCVISTRLPRMVEKDRSIRRLRHLARGVASLERAFAPLCHLGPSARALQNVADLPSRAPPVESPVGLPNSRDRFHRGGGRLKKKMSLRQ